MRPWHWGPIGVNSHLLHLEHLGHLGHLGHRWKYDSQL